MRVTDHTSYQIFSNQYEQSDQHTIDREEQYSQNACIGNDKPQPQSVGGQAALQKDQTGGSKVERTDVEVLTKNSENVPAAKAYDNQKKDVNSPSEQRRQKNSNTKRAFVSGNTTLYSSTADLMAIANTESQETLRGIYVRLSFKLWSVRAKGVNATNKKAVQSAARSVQKVIGKVKGKIKNLQKEDEMTKKAEAARKAKQHRLWLEMRRELAIRRKIRKNKEQKDVADSYSESDGQYFLKSYRDTLPEKVLAEMELRAAGGSNMAAVDAGVSVDAAIAMAGMDSAMGVDTAAAIAEVSGVMVDVGL